MEAKAVRSSVSCLKAIKLLACLSHRSSSNSLHNFLRSICHGIAGDQTQSRFGQSFFPSGNIVALESHDERDTQMRFFNCCDDAGRNDVAIHDAAKNVDQNSFDAGVAQNNFKRGGDLFLARAAADIEEIRRVAAKMLDDVHRRHRETGAVD